MCIYLWYLFSLCVLDNCLTKFIKILYGEKLESTCAALGPPHLHRTLNDTPIRFFFSSFPNLRQFGSILAESRWFGPIHANLGWVVPIQRRFRPSRADYSQNWPRNWPKYMLKEGPIPNHLLPSIRSSHGCLPKSQHK